MKNKIYIIIFLLILSIAGGCSYKTITYGTGNISTRYNTIILKDSTIQLNHGESAFVILKLKPWSDYYEISDGFNVDFSNLTASLEGNTIYKQVINPNNEFVFESPGDDVYKIIFSDSDTHKVITEVYSTGVNGGQGRIITVGVDKSQEFVDGFATKKISRKEWRKIKRLQKE